LVATPFDEDSPELAGAVLSEDEFDHAGAFAVHLFVVEQDYDVGVLPDRPGLAEIR